jgi:hypothetical protein
MQAQDAATLSAGGEDEFYKWKDIGLWDQYWEHTTEGRRPYHYIEDTTQHRFDST